MAQGGGTVDVETEFPLFYGGVLYVFKGENLCLVERERVFIQHGSLFEGYVLFQGHVIMGERDAFFNKRVFGSGWLFCITICV